MSRMSKEERLALLTEYGKARKAWVDWKAYKAAIDIMHNIPQLVRDLDAADAEIVSLKAQVERYEKALIDLRDHGTRHDTHPTLSYSDSSWLIGFIMTYIPSMDNHVRLVAGKALLSPHQEEEDKG